MQLFGSRRVASYSLLGLGLLAATTDAFLPISSRTGRGSHGGIMGPVIQQPLESREAAFPLPHQQPGCTQSRPSSSLSSTVMDTSAPSDVADVEEPMPIDKGRRESVVSSSPTMRRSLTDRSKEVKDELIELVSGGFLTSSARKRALVSELLLKLEALNPTEAPAYSPLLNGPWTFLYTGGISPGMLGLQLVAALSNAANGAVDIKDTTLMVSRAQPRVEVSTTVSVFGRETTFKIRTNLEPESDLRLRETYIEANTGSLRIPLPRQGIFERSLFISYLDDDLLVVRDSFGAPDILIRKDKSFYTPFSGVPSASDDDLAPGAG